MDNPKFFALLILLCLMSIAPQAQKKAPPTTSKAAVQKPKPATAGPTPDPEEKPKDLQPQQLPTPLNPNEPFGRLVLLPLDDRPAVTQFAQMIGAIGDHQVVVPPKELIGKFTTPGNPEKIQEWLGLINYAKFKKDERDILSVEDKDRIRRWAGTIDYSKVDALVVSVDMLAYGGLIASRAPETQLKDALHRLEFFRWFKQEYPSIPVYAFNVLMRVAPTASKQTRGWRDDLARWAELMDRVPKTNDAKLKAELDELKSKLDRDLIENYLAARRRNLQVNLAMIKFYENKIIDHLIFLQDDAREYGLHRHDQLILKEKIKSLGFEDEIPIYNGADEGALSLVSATALNKYRQKIKVAVVYSSEKGRKIIAPYEDHPLEFTVENQIKAAGGQLISPGEQPDYTLYVNAPETTVSEFTMFSKNLVTDLKAGKPVVLADVLFPAPHFSGADKRLIAILKTENLLDKLTGYAAWNTAGNTLGTAIPAANMRILTQQKINTSPERAARATKAHLEFLLHRYAGDYLYHDVVRFEINNELRRPPAIPTDELTEEIYARINKKTQDNLRPLIEKFFAENFQGRSYSLGTYEGVKKEIKIIGLKDLRIDLPWPRTFESKIEFKFESTLN